MSDKDLIVCRVVRNGFVYGKGKDSKEIPIGEKIKLTARQVQAFVGKIKPLEEIEAEESKAATLGDLAKMTEGYEALEKENADLKEKINALTEEYNELVETHQELEAELEQAKASKKGKKK